VFPTRRDRVPIVGRKYRIDIAYLIKAVALFLLFIGTACTIKAGTLETKPDSGN